MVHRGLIFWLLGGFAAAALVAAALPTSPKAKGPSTIGPIAPITEASSGVTFSARVDTGAAVTSIHCPPDWVEIQDAAEDPWENIGKWVRLRVENLRGEEAWVETRIADYSEVRSANGAEYRYRVRLPLRLDGIEKEAIVNLNDRSRMTYRMLLGRDFLAGDFVVDVSRSIERSF